MTARDWGRSAGGHEAHCVKSRKLSVGRRTLESATAQGEPMIDWDSETWGGGVTYAADGSWLEDKHAEGQPDEDAWSRS